MSLLRRNPTQETPYIDQKQTALVQVEIENKLNMGAIQETDHQAGEFLSNIFLVGKA